MKNDKVIVVVGKGPTYKKLRCGRFLPGLVINRAPDKSKSSQLNNITHRDTGVAILSYIPSEVVDQVRKLLRKEDWSLSLGEIFASNKHREVVEGVVDYMANKESSKKQEKRIADDLGGRVQPASGSRWGYKRDVRTPEFLVEAKISDSKSVSVVARDLRFLKQQAYQMGKNPAYVVEVRGSSVAILPKEDVPLEYLENVVPFPTRGVKSFTVNDKLIKMVEENIAEVNLMSGRYLVLNYDDFLDITRGEHDE